MEDRPVADAAGADPWASEPFRADADLDWEALRVGSTLHLYCYLRDTVLALALIDSVT